MSKKPHGEGELVSNRKARYEYEILETFEAGIVLVGTEIKSLKDSGATLSEAYVKVLSGVPLLIGAFIPHYAFGNIHNHEEKRDRTLLLHKGEIAKLCKAVEQKGLTIVPLSIYLKKGRAKLLIGLAKGKKLHDKRESIKDRDSKREIQRIIKSL